MTTQSAILGKALAEPQSLAEERLVNAILSDAPESADTSEGNLMSLKLLKSLYDNDDDKDASTRGAIEATIKAESKYLIQAMKLLNSNTIAGAKLVGKFGRGLAGAVALSKVLKTKADEAEINAMLETAVVDLAEHRKPVGAVKAFDTAKTSKDLVAEYAKAAK